MRATEFLKEGNDKSPSDVEKNHPDVYKFITGITGPYSIQSAKVQAFDLGKNHFVVVEMQPSAGMGNTMAVMKGKGIDFEEAGERRIKGEHNGLEFEIRDDNVRGNITETWTFKIPITSIEEDATDSHSVWDVYCGHNFWTGSRYELSYRPIRVIAPSKESAKDFVTNNLDKVEEYFRSIFMRKGTGRIRLLRKKEAFHLKEKSVGQVKPSGLMHGTAMNDKGEMVAVTRDEQTKKYNMQSEQPLEEAPEQWAVYPNFDMPRSTRDEPVDGKTFTNKMDAQMFAKRLNSQLDMAQRKYQRMKFSVKPYTAPIQEADFDPGMSSGHPGEMEPTPEELISQYNKEYMKAGGSEASLTGPDTVTVQSLDDWEDMFVGSTADFKEWIDNYGPQAGDGWDDESADYDHNPDDPDDDMSGDSRPMFTQMPEGASETKWNYTCPSGHKTPYEGPGAPEYTVRPCPQCGLKARATKEQAVAEGNAEQDYYDAKAVHDRYPTERRGSELAKLKKMAGIKDMSQSPEHKAARAKMYKDQDTKDREEAKFAADKIKGIFK